MTETNVISQQILEKQRKILPLIQQGDIYFPFIRNNTLGLVTKRFMAYIIPSSRLNLSWRKCTNPYLSSKWQIQYKGNTNYEFLSVSLFVSGILTDHRIQIHENFNL